MGVVATPLPAPSLHVILEPRRWVRSEKFFHGPMSQDEATAKILFGVKALPILKKNLKHLLGGGGGGVAETNMQPWPSEG